MKKEEGKKAQFTVFVILGIVIFVMAIFIIIAVASISTLNQDRTQRQAITDFLDSAMVNYYVQTCLDSATTQATDEIMLQGGALYEHQNGPDETTQLGITHVKTLINYGADLSLLVNTSYSIHEENNCPLILPSERIPPHYPKTKTPLVELFGIYESLSYFECSSDYKTKRDFSGFFGQNNLTRLCTFGSNNSKIIFGSGPSPCHLNWIENNTPNQNISIEEKLQTRTLELLQGCVDFEFLAELQGINISMQETEQPEIEIILNRNSMSVKAIYPFTAQIRQGEATIIKHEFTYASPLRITRLHNYAMSLLAADTKNILFNLSSPEHQTNHDLFIDRFPNVQRYHDSFFEVQIIPTNCALNNDVDCAEYEYDRILIIKDKASYVGGRPLTFTTAIKNRRPALDIIGINDPLINYDILVNVGDELIISPQGYDPDDRNLTYSYFGWKQNYTRICAFNDEGELICDDQIPLEVPILTNSQLFQQTKRAVNYTTNATDVGKHVVRVFVHDVEGLYDYQDVRILVLNIPTVEIQTESIYNFPENLTSIEDPIKIKGTIENYEGYNVEYINYTWKVQNASETIIMEQQIQASIIPVLPPFNIEFPIPDQTIYNSTLLQTIHLLNLTHTGLYKVILSAGVMTTEWDYFQIEDFELELNVTQCIPYRNPNLIYPYTSPIITNPFLANHTCCDTDYTLFPNTYPCYTATYYGEFNALKNKAQEELKNDSFTDYLEYIGQIQINPNLASPTQINNVFKMQIDRYCDGNRGNICAGELQATITTELDCLFNPALLEQCQGPSTAISDTIPVCTLYTTTSLSNKNSFELEFNQPGATGICQDAPATSTINPITGIGTYNLSGVHLCEAAYCASGNCDRVFLGNNCDCSQTCGAEWYGQAFNWTQNTCKYGGGNSSTCNFIEQNQTKCTATNNYCYNATEEFCYKDVACTPTGVEETRVDYCKKGELFEANITAPPTLPNPTIVNVCLHGATPQEQGCNSNGECTHTKTFFQCPTGTTSACNAALGARCCTTPTNCQPATMTYNPTPANIHEYFYP